MRGNDPQPGAVPEETGAGIPGTSDEIDQLMDGAADGADEDAR